MRKFLHILFGGYKLVSKNDLYALYAATRAAYSQLDKIKISDERLRHKVEKDQVLSILNEAKQITNRLT